MNIEIKLDKDFEEQFQRLKNKYGEKFSTLNGFSNEQLGYTTFIDNFIDKNTVADSSIDGNANVGTKDICSLENEMSKPHSKLLSFNKIYYEMKKKYGKNTADLWLEEEWNGSFYLHDAPSSSMKSYCYAYDLERLVNEGLYFIDTFNNQPPKHLSTYTDFVGEFVSFATNRTSGAVGLPSFLIYSFYFWKKDCDSGHFIKSPSYYRDQSFQEIIYKLNQPYLRVNQSAFTNFSIFDRPYLTSLFGGKKYPDGSFVIDFIDELLEYQKSFMEIVSKVREKNVMTFPVLTYALLKGDKGFVDEEFAKWCCAHNMQWADSNFFISKDVTSLSNCCRLLSNVKSTGYFNSIGGTALEVGSIKVNTINLARIAYESNSEEEYIETLKNKVNLCLKTLDSVRYIISRNVEKGLLPNYTHGLINIDSQYNTIGIIGIYETLQEFGYVKKDKFGYVEYADEGISFAKKILQCVNTCKDNFETSYMKNVEQIPAERAAAVLMYKDKELYPDKVYELPLYGNQWVPLGVKTTIKNKIAINKLLDKECNGGSIEHINIDSPFKDFDTAWNMLNYVSDNGVTYFAFNLKINSCEDNHGFYGNLCSVCGKPVSTTYQRIVGFITPLKTYSDERKNEFELRNWMDLNSLSEI